MLVCDLAIREAETGKFSLIGIFESITTAALPTLHPQLSVYVKLTDAEGHYPLRLELVQLETATIVARAESGLDVKDRMGSVELVLELRNLTFGEPGLYEFRLLANDRFVGSKTFQVIKFESPGGR